MNRDLKDMRKSYEKYSLLESEASADPLELFHAWFALAEEEGIEEPNAMFLATVDTEGQPSGRVVLLKEIREGGFVFFTNYQSRKGKDIQHNQKVALTFFWHSQERQIRIEGTAGKKDESYARNYFAKRPRVSQLGALSSKQSEVVPDRTFLETEFERLETLYEGKEIPMPEDWGAYIVYPHRLEFWQGRQGRLHDRLLYTKNNGIWERCRLSP
ncbi:pyridoxine/pyridoxamine 5'-phosphate oxidase [Leptospira ryugenii]|uniref:Pyridoxine/pyridoxamine 5'-phosphate oxidase n=1 Tax=Leptospira ryugenii TaxID=1917863 RepID=A0A2P2DY20_9LEPT|nr:pyridoxamine 5'-phosphate oxidase [Leptospira ryugenii]GBF49513.1 pyridoxine/pyridoxamine 5'-phosphate oxidase [Leptospira ryugenii]